MQGLFSMSYNAVLLPCCEISCSCAEVHKVLWLSQLICTEQLAFDSAASHARAPVASHPSSACSRP